MAFGKPKKHLYVIENLSQSNAPHLKKVLLSVPEIMDVRISVTEGMIEILAKKNPEKSVEMACGVTNCRLRTSVHKSEL